VLARPLIKAGKLSSITGASFTMAFFSGVSANSMLAEAFDQERLAKKELVLANLFNSLPRFFLHLPTVFFLTVPLIEGAALIYVGITFCAALLQTFLVVLLGRFLLPGKPEDRSIAPAQSPDRVSWLQAGRKCWQRFRKRIRKILKFMVPAYILFFLLNRLDVFDRVEDFLAAKAWFLAWLPAKSLSIVIMHVTAEFSAGLAAASALLADESLTYNEVVMALLAGNVLAAPVRALRHQLPYYLGIFPSRLALELIGVSQIARIICIVTVGFIYYRLTFW
ncbi:MAG: hypothetical protein ACLFV2_10805, partial [Desulfurivibrionaceae bacterium]